MKRGDGSHCGHPVHQTILDLIFGQQKVRWRQASHIYTSQSKYAFDLRKVIRWYNAHTEEGGKLCFQKMFSKFYERIYWDLMTKTGLVTRNAFVKIFLKRLRELMSLSNIFNEYCNLHGSLYLISLSSRFLAAHGVRFGVANLATSRQGTWSQVTPQSLLQVMNMGEDLLNCINEKNSQLSKDDILSFDPLSIEKRIGIWSLKSTKMPRGNKSIHSVPVVSPDPSSYSSRRSRRRRSQRSSKPKLPPPKKPPVSPPLPVPPSQTSIPHESPVIAFDPQSFNGYTAESALASTETHEIHSYLNATLRRFPTISEQSPFSKITKILLKKKKENIILPWVPNGGAQCAYISKVTPFLFDEIFWSFAAQLSVDHAPLQMKWWRTLCHVTTSCFDENRNNKQNFKELLRNLIFYFGEKWQKMFVNRLSNLNATGLALGWTQNYEENLQVTMHEHGILCHKACVVAFCDSCGRGIEDARSVSNCDTMIFSVSKDSEMTSGQDVFLRAEQDSNWSDCTSESCAGKMRTIVMREPARLLLAVFSNHRHPLESLSIEDIETVQLLSFEGECYEYIAKEVVFHGHNHFWWQAWISNSDDAITFDSLYRRNSASLAGSRIWRSRKTAFPTRDIASIIYHRVRKVSREHMLVREKQKMTRDPSSALSYDVLPFLTGDTLENVFSCRLGLSGVLTQSVHLDASRVVNPAKVLPWRMKSMLCKWISEGFEDIFQGSPDKSETLDGCDTSIFLSTCDVELTTGAYKLAVGNKLREISAIEGVVLFEVLELLEDRAFADNALMNIVDSDKRIKFDALRRLVCNEHATRLVSTDMAAIEMKGSVTLLF